MSNLHYFQRYSQPENVITNNTLLLFKRLYSHSPSLFEAFCNNLLSDEVPDLNIGLLFQQQKKLSKGSVPDGFILQTSFRILIETKTHVGFDVDQLVAHTKSFQNEDRKILLLLAPEEPTESFRKSINDRLNAIKEKELMQFETVFASFEILIKNAEECLSERDYEMRDLLEDYRQFCTEAGMISNSKYLLRVRTARYSLTENFECDLYYEWRKKGFTSAGYFGLYANKSIVGIGRVSNVIKADIVNGKFEYIESELGIVPTSNECERILKAVPLAKSNAGYEIEKDHRFIMVEKFFKTDYRKSTPYPIQQSKYFDLRDVVGINIPEDVQTIAKILEAKVWKENNV